MAVKTCGDILHYHCWAKKSFKCKAKAKVMVVDGPGNTLEYEVIGVDDDHNHAQNKGSLLAEKMMHEMEHNYLQELSIKPRVTVSDVRKFVQKNTN